LLPCGNFVPFCACLEPSHRLVAKGACYKFQFEKFSCLEFSPDLSLTDLPNDGSKYKSCILVLAAGGCTLTTTEPPRAPRLSSAVVTSLQIPTTSNLAPGGAAAQAGANTGRYPSSGGGYSYTRADLTIVSHLGQLRVLRQDTPSKRPCCPCAGSGKRRIRFAWEHRLLF